MLRALTLALSTTLALAGTPLATRADGQHNPGADAAEPGAEQEPEIKVTLVPLTGRSVKAGRAEGVVDAPMSAVQAVVEDYAGYETFMPKIRASRVLSQRGDTALVYLQASIARNTITLWAQLKISARNSDPKTRVIDAKMLQGNMDAMTARWELTPVDEGHTLVAFQMLMDPKVPVPASLVSDENENASKKTIRALRRVVAKRGLLATNEQQ